MQNKNDCNILKITIFVLVLSSLVYGIAFSQIVTDTNLWQQIQVYSNPSTEDRAALKNCYAQLSTLYPNSAILDQALYFYAGYWERKGLQNDAVKLCKRIINTYPNSSYVYPAYLDIMRIYQDRENIAGLTQVYSDFKTYTTKYLQYPELTIENKAEVYLQLGYYAQVLKQHKEAQSAFIQAYQLAPKSDSGQTTLYYTGLSYLSERTYTGASAALIQFNSILSQYPGDTEADNSKFYIILAQHRSGDKDGAISGLQEYVKQYPNSEYTPQALYLTAMSYLYNKYDYPTAISYFEQTMDWLTTHNERGDDPKLSSNMELGLVSAGMLYHCCEHIAYAHLYAAEIGRYSHDSALNWGKRLQTLFPSDRGMHQFGKLVPLLVLEQEKQWLDLHDAANALMVQYSQDTKKWLTVPGAVLRLKGDALMQLGRDTEAIAVYDEVVKKYKGSCSDAIALYQIAKCYEQLGDTYSALSVYNVYIEQYAAIPEVILDGYINKAMLLVNTGQAVEAEALMEEYLEKYSDCTDIRKENIIAARTLKDLLLLQLPSRQ